MRNLCDEILLAIVLQNIGSNILQIHDINRNGMRDCVTTTGKNSADLVSVDMHVLIETHVDISF